MPMSYETITLLWKNSSTWFQSNNPNFVIEPKTHKIETPWLLLNQSKGISCVSD